MLVARLASAGDHPSLRHVFQIALESSVILGARMTRGLFVLISRQMSPSPRFGQVVNPVETVANAEQNGKRSRERLVGSVLRLVMLATLVILQAVKRQVMIAAMAVMTRRLTLVA